MRFVFIRPVVSATSSNFVFRLHLHLQASQRLIETRHSCSACGRGTFTYLGEFLKCRARFKKSREIPSFRVCFHIVSISPGWVLRARAQMQSHINHCIITESDLVESNAFYPRNGVCIIAACLTSLSARSLAV